MINSISNIDARLQQNQVVKTAPSQVSVLAPPILGFKTPNLKEKALIRIKKVKRGDNLVMVGDIDDDYVDIIEEKIPASSRAGGTSFNFFQLEPERKQTKFLKNCYLIDYIQSPKMGCGLGTEAIKNLAEKAMFDPKTDGRIVTFCAPVWRESSPAQFFYKLGFRFMDNGANKYIEDCIIKKVPDLPPQIGMMYLPKANIHKLLRYGDLF